MATETKVPIPNGHLNKIPILEWSLGKCLNQIVTQYFKKKKKGKKRMQ